MIVVWQGNTGYAHRPPAPQDMKIQGQHLVLQCLKPPNEHGSDSRGEADFALHWQCTYVMYSDEQRIYDGSLQGTRSDHRGVPNLFKISPT